MDLGRGTLADLARLRDVTSRRLSSWDRRGGNVDCVTIAPGTTHVLGEIAVCAAGGGTGRQFSPDSDRILRRLCARAPAARWAELREQIAAIFARGNALNLDRKQTILGAFFAIERIAR